jgi:hypothetical protein
LAAARVALAWRLHKFHPTRAAAEAFDAIAVWAISFRYPADDPLQAEPLPEPSEVATWLLRIDALRAEVASQIATQPG